MSVFVYIVHEINLALIIPVAIIIYFSILYIIKGFSKDDISLIKDAIKKEKSS